MGTTRWEDEQEKLLDAVVTAVARCLCQQHTGSAKDGSPDRWPCDRCRQVVSNVFDAGLTELLGSHGGSQYACGQLGMSTDEAIRLAFEGMVEQSEEILARNTRRAQQRTRKAA